LTVSRSKLTEALVRRCKRFGRQDPKRAGTTDPWQEALDFRLGSLDGEVHSLKSTADRFGLDETQLRVAERKALFGPERSAFQFRTRRRGAADVLIRGSTIIRLIGGDDDGNEERMVRCSFCRAQTLAGRAVSARRLWICSNCVSFAARALDLEPTHPTTSHVSRAVSVSARVPVLLGSSVPWWQRFSRQRHSSK